MSWSALFDRTHILKGVPVDSEIELQCKRCRTLFRTMNAYYIGYSEINYINQEEAGRCRHNLSELQTTTNWFPSREIHQNFTDSTWASLFDYSHIIEGAPIDADIELQCRKCKTLFRTLNAYYIGYSTINYVNHDEMGQCNHSLKDLKATKRWFPKSHHEKA